MKNTQYSVLLDLIRFCAAMVVLLSHYTTQRVNGGWLWQLELEFFAHHAVMVFFVLSGLVMAYVTQNKESTIYKYLSARFVRLYSVVLPMLIVVPILDYFGGKFSPSTYIIPLSQIDNPAVVIAAGVTFFHEIWFNSIRYFSNIPYWSISYEFFYYLAFGAAFFLKGFWRWIALCAVALIAGPKILLLFPVWLLGVAAWHLIGYRIPTKIAAIAFVCIILGYVWFVTQGRYEWLASVGMDLASRIGVSEHDLGFSSRWLADYCVGLLVAGAFVMLANFSAIFTRTLLPIQSVIRWLAGATFTIYLLHVPLMYFLVATLPGSTENPVRGAAILIITIIILFAFSEITERRKKVWARAFDRMALICTRYLTSIKKPSSS